MILVTGAAGMVGSHLLDVFSEDELYRTDLQASDQIHALDCRDRDQVMETIERVRPDDGAAHGGGNRRRSLRARRRSRLPEQRPRRR